MADLNQMNLMYYVCKRTYQSFEVVSWDNIKHRIGSNAMSQERERERKKTAENNKLSNSV